MKKTFAFMLMMAIACCLSASAETFCSKNLFSNPDVTKFTVTTDANGDIASIDKVDGVDWDSNAWHIKDLSGATNVRNSPNGKICMKLKAHVQYEIYTDRLVNGWLRITSCYNLTQGYWVRLHSSSTGTYWIARSVLY